MSHPYMRDGNTSPPIPLDQPVCTPKATWQEPINCLSSILVATLHAQKQLQAQTNFKFKPLKRQIQLHYNFHNNGDWHCMPCTWHVPRGYLLPAIFNCSSHSTFYFFIFQLQGTKFRVPMLYIYLKKLPESEVDRVDQKFF